MKIDLDEWEKAEKDPLLQKTLPVCHERILALIERVRFLENTLRVCRKKLLDLNRECLLYISTGEEINPDVLLKEDE